MSSSKTAACRRTSKIQIRRNYVVGAVCLLAFLASSFAYQLPGLTAKAASFVVGYWAAMPFVHLATGHGFGFKKKRAAPCGGACVDVHERCDAQREDEEASQEQADGAPHTGPAISRSPSVQSQ